MIFILQAVQPKAAAETLLSPAPSSKGTSVKSSTLDFKKLKNEALTDLTPSGQTKVKDKDDQASEQAAETAGLGLVLPSAGQAPYTDTMQEPVQIIQTVLAAQQVQSSSPVELVRAAQAAINALSANEADQETVEQSEGTQDLSQNIAGILEGLLRDGKSADEAMQQVEQLLTDAYQAATKENVTLGTDEDSTDAVVTEAGMLEEKSSNTIRNLKDVIHEYLCSLENTGNTEQAEEATNTRAADNTVVVLERGLNQQEGESGDDGKKAKIDVAPRTAESEKAQPSVPLVAAERSHAFITEPEQQVSSTASVKADMADNISRIVESISSQSSEGTQELTVSLKPEHLGKLSIKLIMDSDGLRAQIKAADSTVSGLIRSELNSLTDLLKDRGIPVTQIDVSYDTAAFLTDSRQGNSGQHPGSSSKNRRTYALNGTDPYGGVSTLTDSQQLLVQGSSMEFQA